MILHGTGHARRVLVILATTASLAACGGQPATPTPPASSPQPSGQASAPASTPTPSPPAASPAQGSPAASTSQEPSANPSSTGALDACALLPPDKLAAIVGPGSKGNVMAGGGWRAAQCAWNIPGSSFLLSVGTPSSIEQAADPAAPDAAALLAAYRQAASAQGKAADVAGVGDAAVGSAAGIAFTKAGAYVEMMVMGPALKGDQLIRIARLAAAGL